VAAPKRFLDEAARFGGCGSALEKMVGDAFSDADLRRSWEKLRFERGRSSRRPLILTLGMCCTGLLGGQSDAARGARARLNDRPVLVVEMRVLVQVRTAEVASRL
jgi:hypothetical protein